MTHIVWRIAADAPDYTAADLSGKGAEKTGGRWNRKGTAMLYTSQTIALACLETLVHLSGGFPLPLNRHLVSIAIPDGAWDRRSVLAPRDYAGWDSVPAGAVSLDWGTEWVRSGRSLVAQVPSIVVPEEFNVLLNPAHPDSRQLHAQKLRRWNYDPRLGSVRE